MRAAPSSTSRVLKESRYLRRNPGGDWFVSDCSHHHPVSANLAFPARRRIARFCGDFRPLSSRILVSAGVRAFERRFLALRLCIQKFRSRRPWLSARPDSPPPRIPTFEPPHIRELVPAL